MQKNLKLYSILGALAFTVVLFYFLFSTEVDTKKEKVKNTGDLTSLLSVKSKKSDASNSTENPAAGSNKEEASIFDSDFMKPTKGMEFSEEGKSPKSGDVGDIPINPQDGKPYTKEQMDQFEELRQEMPNNDLIPRRMTPEKKAEKERKAKELQEITAKVSNSSASRSEVEVYYGSQEKVLQDRLEIIEYLVKGQEEGGEEDKDGQFKKILEGTRDQIKNLEEQKKNALSKF